MCIRDSKSSPFSSRACNELIDTCSLPCKSRLSGESSRTELAEVTVRNNISDKRDGLSRFRLSPCRPALSLPHPEDGLATDVLRKQLAWAKVALQLSASIVDFRPMHSSKALHAHADRQVLGNAPGSRHEVVPGWSPIRTSPRFSSSVQIAGNTPRVLTHAS